MLSGDRHSGMIFRVQGSRMQIGDEEILGLGDFEVS